MPFYYLKHDPVSVLTGGARIQKTKHAWRCTVAHFKKENNLLPSQAFFLLGSILNLPGLKFYLLYCEQGKTRPHDRAASELGKQGFFS